MGKQWPFSAQEVRTTGRLPEHQGHSFPVSSGWCSNWSVMPPWPWDVRAGGLWSGCDSWNCCTPFYLQEKDKIWHRGELSGKMESTWVLDGTARTWLVETLWGVLKCRKLVFSVFLKLILLRDPFLQVPNIELEMFLKTLKKNLYLLSSA